MRADRSHGAWRLGSYRLLRLLGRGGMAEVYEAERVGAHGFAKRVAIKRILPQHARDPRLVAMFCDEARIHATLSHPNLLQVLDFGEEDGELFIVLELVEGMSVADLLSRVAARRRAVDLAPALYIAHEVLLGLAHAHAACDELGRPRQLVHRDVAPSNILIGKAGQVRLGDFGILHAADIESRTAPGEIKGKIGYVSPEQAMGLPLDARSDIFSLGVVLAELLIGEPLFPGATEVEILRSLHAGDLSRLDRHVGHIPPEVMRLLRAALAPLASRRFESAQHLAAEIDAIARERQLELSSYALCEWLSELGLVTLRSDVRQRATPSPPRARLPSVDAFCEEITLAEDEVATLAERPSAPPVFARTMHEPYREEPTYRVMRVGGAFSEAVHLPVVLAGIATGRIGATTRISRDGGRAMPLSSVPDLARLAGRAAYRFGDAVALRASLRGRPPRVRLPRIVFDAVRNRLTGLLCARRGRAQRRIYFADGVPWFTSSTEERELLGSLLVRRGRIQLPALEVALAQGWRRGRRVGEALVDAGLLPRNEVERALVLQRRTRLAGLFCWDDCEVVFVDGLEPGEDRVDLGEAPHALVAHAVLDGFTEDDAQRLLADVASAPLERGDAMPVEAFHLPDALTRALTTAGDGRSPRQLVRDLAGDGVSAGNVAHAVLIGLSARVLSAPGWT